jgi:hypothetical protein
LEIAQKLDQLLERRKSNEEAKLAKQAEQAVQEKLASFTSSSHQSTPLPRYFDTAATDDSRSPNFSSFNLAESFKAWPPNSQFTSNSASLQQSVPPASIPLLDQMTAIDAANVWPSTSSNPFLREMQPVIVEDDLEDKFPWGMQPVIVEDDLEDEFPWPLVNAASNRRR